MTAASRGWQILTRSLSGWLAHEGARLSASLSLYSLLSLAPLVIICIAIASLGFGRSAAQTAVVNEVRSLMGEDGARTVETVIEYGKLPRTGGIASRKVFTSFCGNSRVQVVLAPGDAEAPAWRCSSDTMTGPGCRTES